MDKESINYIIRYLSNLMTHDEKLALQHQMYIVKSTDNKAIKDMMKEKGWINNDPQILNLLKNSYEEFQINVAKRMMNETPEKVFFNNCPKCGKLARTPYAKQCRYCKHSWRAEQTK